MPNRVTRAQESGSRTTGNLEGGKVRAWEEMIFKGSGGKSEGESWHREREIVSTSQLWMGVLSSNTHSSCRFFCGYMGFEKDGRIDFEG